MSSSFVSRNRKVRRVSLVLFKGADFESAVSNGPAALPVQTKSRATCTSTVPPTSCPRVPQAVLYSAKLGRHCDLNAATNAAIDKTRFCLNSVPV